VENEKVKDKRKKRKAVYVVNSSEWIDGAVKNSRKGGWTHFKSNVRMVKAAQFLDEQGSLTVYIRSNEQDLVTHIAEVKETILNPSPDDAHVKHILKTMKVTDKHGEESLEGVSTLCVLGNFQALPAPFPHEELTKATGKEKGTCLDPNYKRGYSIVVERPGDAPNTDHEEENHLSETDDNPLIEEHREEDPDAQTEHLLALLTVVGTEAQDAVMALATSPEIQSQFLDRAHAAGFVSR
jgi:hypothetical protein